MLCSELQCRNHQQIDIPELITNARISHPNITLTFPTNNANQLKTILDTVSRRRFFIPTLLKQTILLRGALAAQRNGDARYALDLLATAAYYCQEEGHNTVTEDDLRRAQRLPEASLTRRSGRLSPPHKV